MQPRETRHLARWLAASISLLAAALSGVRAESSLRPWDQYQVIMWIGDSASKDPERLPLFYSRLREMGVTAGMVYGGDADASPLLTSHLPYYVENIVGKGLCLKFNSKVQDWDGFVTRWAKQRDEASLTRDYCLDDPEWREWARGRMRAAAQQHGNNRPLAYDIRDELSVTISANPFDYDFSALSLAGFRSWLHGQYSSIEALNQEWETRFSSWDEVKPWTTDQAKNRVASGESNPRGQPDWQALEAQHFDPVEARREPSRWNLSPWADFRTYMDIALARTLDDLRQAAHQTDPLTPVGIEGTQMPHAFGGYDLLRLSQVLDWVEPYDIGNAHAILSSFMGGKPILTTVFESESDAAQRRLWHLLLEGDRGCLIWWSEDCIDWKSRDYALTKKALALAPVLKQLTSPLARVFLLGRREFDPIAIYYSQASIQVDWQIESCVDGSTWLRRFSSFESHNNRMARVRNSWLKAVQDLGYSPRFASVADLDELARTPGAAALILPTARALSRVEAERIHGFLEDKVQRGRILLTDGTPGLFDEHGRFLQRSPLEGIFPLGESAQACFAAKRRDGTATNRKTGDVGVYTEQRAAKTASSEWPSWIGEQLRMLPVEVRLPLAAHASVFRYQLGNARLLAIERNINYSMSEELKQAGGNQNLESTIDMEAELLHGGHVYDLAARKYLGETNRIHFSLSAWRPSLFAVLPTRVDPARVLEELLPP